MATIYDHIAQNKRRTWLLVLLFPLTLMALVYACLFGFHYLSSENIYYHSVTYVEKVESPVLKAVTLANQTAEIVLPFLLLFVVGWIITVYYWGDAFLLGSVKGIEVHREEQPELYNLVENLCISQGLPMPRVYIINDNSLNAFATGRDPEHASVILTKGIIQRLERIELEGVVAHELAHIQNRDIRLMLITVVGIAFFTFLSEICFRAGVTISHGRSGKGKGEAVLLLFLLGILLAIYGYLVAPLIRLAVSRTREFQADASAALMTRHPGALASALQKISFDPRVEILESHASMAAMCIENPLKKERLFTFLSGMFATHPPVEKRIAALKDMAGIV